MDCVVDILDDDPMVQYPSRYRRYDGIMVPPRRRVFVRNFDGSPILDPIVVAVDVDDVSFR